MIFSFFFFCVKVTFFTDGCKTRSLECSRTDPCVFSVNPTRENPMAFMFSLSDLRADDVRYTNAIYSSKVVSNDWIVATEEEKEKIWKTTSPISIYIKPQTEKEITFRGGIISPIMCPNGSIISSKKSFNLVNYLYEPLVEKPTTFCVIYMHDRGSVTIQNTLRDSDSISYRYGNRLEKVNKGIESRLNAGQSPVFLIIYLSEEQNYRNLQFAFQDITESAYAEKEEYIESVAISPLPETDEEYLPQIESSSSSSEEESSSSSSDEESSSSSSDEESSSSSSEEESSSSSSDEESSSSSSEEEVKPSEIVSESNYIASRTPEPTWDGEWDEPEEVIVRGHDIPEIHETHPPIQTNYEKPIIPKVTKMIHFSCGGIVIAFVVIMTIINIVRTISKVRRSRHRSSNNSASDMDASSFYYSSSVAFTISSENNFVLSD